MFDSPILISCAIGCSFIILVYTLFFALKRDRSPVPAPIFESGAHSIGRGHKAYSLIRSPQLFFCAGLIGLSSLLFVFLMPWIFSPQIEWGIGLIVASQFILIFGLYGMALMRKNRAGEEK